ncbi:hypothetical protein OC835_004887 [Tilletia horrida]|nr:hypothetical protein OC835_004887 [Tilletia horrida]
MPALLSGCRSGGNFDSLPRGQRGPNAAIHKLQLQRLATDSDDFGSSNSHAGASCSSSRPASPRIGTEAGAGASSASSSYDSDAASPSKDRRRQADHMRPVENIAGGGAAKVERARSSPFPQSAPTSPNVNHPHAHSHHGAGTPTRAKHRIVDKRQIGLPTNFQHTGHIGRASYSAATSMMDTAAIQAQLSQVAAALNMEIDLDKPAEEQVEMRKAEVAPVQEPALAQPPVEAAAQETPPSPEMQPLPLSHPASPSKRHSAVPSPLSSPSKASKALPTPPPTSHGYAEASIRMVPNRASAALPSPPSGPSALPLLPEASPVDIASPAAKSRSPAHRAAAAPSTMSPASQLHQQALYARPLSPRTAGPSQGQALRRKPVPRASDFVESTSEQRAAREEQEAQAVALQRKASSASATQKLESLRRDMMHGLASSEVGELIVPEESAEGTFAAPPALPSTSPSSPSKAARHAPAQSASAGGGGLSVPGVSSNLPASEPSIGSQLLAPRLLAAPQGQGDSSGSTGGLPAPGTIRINGQAYVEGPSGSLITRTANTRWNSALAEITAALASAGGEGGSAGADGLPSVMMSKEEEEALMLRMGIPLGPSSRSNREAAAAGAGAGGPGLPSETIRLKAELADVAQAIHAMDGDDGPVERR